MKSTRTRVLSIGAALMLAFAFAAAQAPHGFGGPDGDVGPMMGFFSDYLDLSSAQQDQVKAIWDKEKSTLQPLMQQMNSNRAAMRALEQSGTFDETKTRAQATANAQTQIELEVQHARIKAEMMQVLTADQKTKLASFEAKREARMKNGPPAPPVD
jgi:protein CpxP